MIQMCLDDELYLAHFCDDILEFVSFRFVLANTSKSSSHMCWCCLFVFRSWSLIIDTKANIMILFIIIYYYDFSLSLSLSSIYNISYLFTHLIWQNIMHDLLFLSLLLLIFISGLLLSMQFNFRYLFFLDLDFYLDF